MVTVPRYTSQVSLRGRDQQNFQSNASAKSFGSDIGAGMQQLGQGIGNAADAIAYKQAIQDEADARVATNAFRGNVRQGLYDPQEGYLNQEGGNALGNSREQTLARMREARSEIAADLSPRARRIFEQNADGLMNTAADTTIRHEGVEFKSFTLDAFEASAQGYLDDALLNAGNEDLFVQNMGAAEAELRRASALQGDGKDVIQSKVDKLMAAGHAGRVVEFARSNPIRAFEYLETHKQDLDPAQYSKLYDGLEGSYYAHQAQQMVSESNANILASAREGGDGMTDAYGVPYFISTPESGGNRFAANPDSSAKGVVQFIDDTYLKYVDKLQPAWAAGMSRQEILATRSDREKEGEIYRAFRQDNKNMLNAWGRPITPRNEYMMHHLGPSVTQALLLAEEMGTTSASFLGLVKATLGAEKAAEWKAANSWMVGKTAAGALNWLSQKTGSVGPSAAAQGGVGNPAALMTQALEIENLKLRGAVLEEMRLRMSVSNAVREEQQRIAAEKAWEVIDQGGKPGDIPPELQVEVGTSTMNTIFNAYERKVTGADAQDEERYMELFDLAYGTPEEQATFRELDLNEDRPNLSQPKLEEMKRLQVDMREGQRVMEEQGAAAVIYKPEDFSRAKTDTKVQYQAATGISPTGSMTKEQAQEYSEYVTQLRRGMIDFANEHGRAMTGDEIASYATKLLSPVIIKGYDKKVNNPFSRGDQYFFEVPAHSRSGYEMNYSRDDVPPEEERAIREELLERFKREPTQDEIIEQYESEVLLSMGVPLTIEYREIPQDIRRALFEENPGASEQEIVDMFLVITLEAANRHIVE